MLGRPKILHQYSSNSRTNPLCLFSGIWNHFSNYFGVDGEYWFFRGRNCNVSAALGIHMTNVKWGIDSSGIDTVLLVSTAPAKKLELYGGLKLAFDSLKNRNYSYTMAQIVPGIEYKIDADVDFLAEIGIALNDEKIAWKLINFLSPEPGYKFPHYYNKNPQIPWQKVIVGGSISLFDLKAVTGLSKFGYYGDQPIKITLLNYLISEKLSS